MKLLLSIFLLTATSITAAQGGSRFDAAQNVQYRNDWFHGRTEAPEQVIHAEKVCAIQLVQVNGSGKGVVVNQKAVNATMVCN